MNAAGAERVTQYEQIQTREGMVMVFDWNGAYLGCMGIERWRRLLREDMSIYDRHDRRAVLDRGSEVSDG